MEFVHYSDNPHVSMPITDQYARMTDCGGKPDGLWFCEGDDWADFVRARVAVKDCMFGLEQIKYATTVKLRCVSKLKWICTGEEFDEFAEIFGQISDDTLSRTRGLFRQPPRIDWPRVAQEFVGIVIGPHRADRLNGNPAWEWYQSWDVACGCVWASEAAELSQRTLDTAPDKVASLPLTA
jgi:hypothetical protein